MPRVNRDLQRRMAARRERERRRPAERRYRFASGEPTRVAEESVLDDETLDGAPQPDAHSRGVARQAGPAATSAAVRSSVRPAPRPFSAYRDEYRYVLGDLRRVAVVVGSLLLVLIVLSLVLPH